MAINKIIELPGGLKMKFIITGKEKLEGTEMLLKKVPPVKGDYSARVFLPKNWAESNIAIVKLKEGDNK